MGPTSAQDTPTWVQPVPNIRQARPSMASAVWLIWVGGEAGRPRGRMHEGCEGGEFAGSFGVGACGKGARAQVRA